jgi:murein tripeptide amidase MpaA
VNVTRTRRRLALAAGLAAGLAFAALPAAQAGLLDPATGVVEDAFAPQLVTVTADLAERNVIASSGLDVTEHAGHDYVEVVLHTPADLDLLESLGLPFDVRIADLNARTAEVQQLNAEFAAANATTDLPSERNTYRTLDNYETEMQDLAAENDDIVKLLELPHTSVEGKTIYGIEIATGVNDTERATDERPTFLLMGLHHAREWPSGEHTMEFAYDLVKGYNGELSDEDNARIKPLVEGARTLLIPVVNPDGFEKSIRDGHTLGIDLRPLNDTGLDPLGGSTAILATPGNAYKRKNCRLHEALDGIPVYCDAAASPGGYGVGVDLNRNYGAFHGGPGTADDPASAIYHGGEGFSEPETQNVRELVSERHVTMVISNHTFSNLILRPNGVDPQTVGPDGLPVGIAPDEEAMAHLGAHMAEHNGYENIHGWELYDTTGTTEDYTYNATGGFGYTFEIGPDEFHPPFEHVIDEYLGTADYHEDEFTGRGNREAYLIALEAALDPSTHAIIAGDAYPGTTLRLTRTGSMPTWDPEVTFSDTVETELVVPADGRFEWHVNPSTRPIQMAKRFQVLADEPTQSFVENRAAPGPTEHVDVPWKIDTATDVANVAIDWPLPDDIDLEVYRVSADGTEKLVGSSGNFVDAKERTTFPAVAGDYVIRIINFAAVPGQPVTVTAETFAAEQETVSGLIENWTLTCERDGVVEQVPVIVDRGQRVTVDLDVCGPKGAPGQKKGVAKRR